MALCSVFLFTPFSSKAQALDPTQSYTTGNIVQTTPQGGPTPWVNGVYQDNLTCWGWGDPGYCGPNAIVRPGGNINFSYGFTDLYQVQSIANALPNSGTGLRVNGYNFGFMAKNGNGWDDARQDYLVAYVSFYDKSNILEYDKTYNLNQRFNWTQFNFSENFASSFSTKDLGNVRYGFIGGDNNGWAGPYGPEIYNVSFSLKYSVDPCATNILSSPSCPGYYDAIAKLAPPPVVSNIVTEAPPPPPPPPGTDFGPINISGPILAGPPPPGPPPPGSPVMQSTPPPQQAGPASGGAPTQQASSSQPGPAGSQLRAGEASEPGGAKTTVSLSSVLSMIGSNQEKTSALEKSVVQAADAQAFSAGEAAKQNAEKVAGEAQSQSVSSGGLGSNQTLASFSQSTIFQNSGILQSQGLNLNSSSQQQNNLQSTSRQQSNSAMGDSQVSYSLDSFSRSSSFQIEVPASEGLKFGNKSPVDNAMEAKPTLSSASGGKQNDTVKKNVQNNEAAGNVTIESIAKQPANYVQYFAALPDVTFYAPKEIYKNQKTVDNARTLRGLQGGSDKLHQQMVDQQYK